jgi:hypothetical protein
VNFLYFKSSFVEAYNILIFLQIQPGISSFVDHCLIHWAIAIENNAYMHLHAINFLVMVFFDNVIDILKSRKNTIYLVVLNLDKALPLK